MRPFETPKTKDTGRHSRATCTPVAALDYGPLAAGVTLQATEGCAGDSFLPRIFTHQVIGGCAVDRQFVGRKVRGGGQLVVGVENEEEHDHAHGIVGEHREQRVRVTRPEREPGYCCKGQLGVRFVPGGRGSLPSAFG